MVELLARHADAFFWMGRYLERVESIARMVDVHETFSRDSRGSVDWGALLTLYDDAGRYTAITDEPPSRRSVANFYLLEMENAGSLKSCIHAARYNSRALRHLLAETVWAEMTLLYRDANSLDQTAIDPGALSMTCRRMVERCRTLDGVISATLYRDAGWNFRMIGRLIERADQITRILDVRHQSLVRPELRGDQLEQRAWTVLLRQLGGHKSYLRAIGEVNRDGVVSYLLSDGFFPNSVRFCIDVITDELSTLRRRHNLTGVAGALETVDELSAYLSAVVREDFVPDDIHRTTDNVQIACANISQSLSDNIFSPDDT